MNFSYKNMQMDALNPQQSAGFHYDDPRLNALSFAILAPTAHNMQPWKFALGDNNDIMIFADLNKLLAVSDPFGRQTIISFGCFIELMIIAAAEQGYKVELKLFPNGESPNTLDQGPIAHAIFIKAEDVKTEPLFHYIKKRCSAKYPFKNSQLTNRKLIEDIGTQISPSVDYHSCLDQNDYKVICNLLEQAWLIDFQNPSIIAENKSVYRIGKTQTLAQPDGICLNGFFIEILKFFKLLSADSLSEPTSFIFNEVKKIGQKVARSAKGIVWITTPNNSRLDQIEAGRAWVRVNLMTTKIGIGLHPMSQILQEYPEMDVYRQEIHDKLAKNGETIQMIGCVGIVGNQESSPRWPFPAKLNATTS